MTVSRRKSKTTKSSARQWYLPRVDEQVRIHRGITDDIDEGDDNFNIQLIKPNGYRLDTSACKCIFFNIATRIPVTDTCYSSSTTYPGMNLVWSNEFNNPDISSASWNFEQGDGCPNFYGLGNNEVEFYQTKNASVVDATLMIESRRECRVIRNHTCWRKTSKGKRFFKFGCINIRAHGAYGQSIWPALWMLAQEEKFGGWPESPKDITYFPQWMIVDYVRVLQ